MTSDRISIDPEIMMGKPVIRERESPSNLSCASSRKAPVTPSCRRITLILPFKIFAQQQRTGLHAWPTRK